MTNKRTSLRQELDILGNREESLQKNKNSTRMKVKELERAIEELIESAIINKTIQFDAAEEDPQSLNRQQVIAKITQLLDKKGDIDSTTPKTFDNLRGLESEYAKKVRDLEVIEDKFNQCVAIIPETDETSLRLNHEIQKLKERLDATNQQFSE